MHKIGYPNNGLLLCNEKGQTNDTHNDMAESQKPNSSDYLLYNSII